MAMCIAMEQLHDNHELYNNHAGAKCTYMPKMHMHILHMHKMDV